MARKKTDYREISFLELIKMEHSDHSFKAAMEKYKELEAAGKRPVIRYSEFHGMRVDPAGEFAALPKK